MAFNQSIADQICELIAQGESLRAACDSNPKFPAPSTFIDWANGNSSLGEQYTQARARGADVEFERLDELSDTEPERDDRGKVDPGWVQWQKMRIDTRKWTLARKAPKKYGEKLAIGGADDLPPIKTMTDDQLMNRIKALQAKMTPKAEE